MADTEQIPGELNIKTSISDDLSILLDFHVNLTGYTITGNVVKAGGLSLTPITIDTTQLADGKITIKVANTALALVGIGRDHRWWLKWTTPDNEDRKILAGRFELVE